MMLALLGLAVRQVLTLKKKLCLKPTRPAPLVLTLGLFTKENQRRERDDLDDALDKVMVDTKRRFLKREMF